MRFACIRRRHFDNQSCITRAVNQRDLVSFILYPPSGGCRQGKAKACVVKILAAGQALFGAFTKSHTFKNLLITGTAFVVVRRI